jgi:hypothetical protein
MSTIMIKRQYVIQVKCNNMGFDNIDFFCFKNDGGYTNYDDQDKAIAAAELALIEIKKKHKATYYRIILEETVTEVIKEGR